MFYPVALVTAPTLAFAIGTIVIAAAIVVAVALRRRAPDVYFGIGWMLITLFPVAGVITLLRPALMADRYLYIPPPAGVSAIAALVGLA